MEITKVYDANAESFFNILRNSFKADYQSNTKTFIKADDIQPGLKYKKQFGQAGKSTALVEVEAMKFPLHYKVKLGSNRGSNIIEYVIEPQSDDTISVTYREDYVDEGLFMKMNNKVLYPFFRKKFEKRMTDQVDSLIRHSKVRKEQA